MKALSCTSVSIAAFLALSACGGGGSTPTGINLPSFSPLGSGTMPSSEVLSHLSAVEGFGVAVQDGTLAATLPNTPTATYNGVLFATTDSSTAAGETIGGRFSMTADFNALTVNGAAGDFAYYVDNPGNPTFIEPISGSVPLTNGTITGTSMTADANGTLTDSTDSYSITSNLNGEFFDNNGTGVFRAIVSGTSIPASTGSSEALLGVIAASE